MTDPMHSKDDLAALGRLVTKYGAEQILRALPVKDRDPDDVTFFFNGRRKSTLEFYRTKGFTALPAMPTMSGADIKRFGGGDVTYHLVDGSGAGISDAQAVVITEGAAFYCVPPATY
jgi:hypothetical protein